MSAKDLVKYQFKPGQSGNPTGGRKGLKTFKRASPEAMARIIDAYLYGGPNALGELFKSPDVTPNEQFIIAIIQRAAFKGDAFAMGLVLDRFLGKVSDKVEVKNTTPAPGLEALSDDELEARQALLEQADK